MLKPNKLHVANRLKMIREDLGMTTKELASKAGTTQANLSSYIRGLALPPREIGKNIAHLYKKDEFWLYYGSIEELVFEVIASIGYEKVINQHPEILEKSVENCKYYVEKFDVFPDEYLITRYFFNYYEKIYLEFVEKVIDNNQIKEQINIKQLYYKDKEENWDEVKRRFLDYMWLPAHIVDYGDKSGVLEKYYKFQKEYFEEVAEKGEHTSEIKLVSLYNRKEDFLTYFIEALKDKDSIESFIREISDFKNLEIDYSENKTNRVIKAFEVFKNELEKVKTYRRY